MYCSHFGLHRPPFNNTPDPSFYYSTPDHEEALATLQYATLNRKGFVLITGEVGAGKTLIGRMFIRQIDRQASTAVITHTQLNSRQLLAAICSEFELDVPPDATNLQLADRLQEYLLDQFARDRFVVVLIDEGQNLPDDSFEAIRMLGNLEADDAKLLQVCILGQPELRERFKKESMRQIDQRLFRRFHLPALNQQQTVEYVQRRLSVAGCTRHDLFSLTALDKVFSGSCGIPRVINQICDNALLAAYAQGHDTVDESIVTQVLEQEGLTEPAGIAQAARGTTQSKDAAVEEPYACESGFVAARPTAQQTQARIEHIYGSSPELIEADLVPSNPSNAAVLADAAESSATDISHDGNSHDGFDSSTFMDDPGHYPLRNVLGGAAQQWPVIRQAIDNQRKELQKAIDEVSSRCRQAQEHIEGLAIASAPVAELDELRQLHASETQRVLDEITRSRAGIEQMVSQTETRLAETDAQLRSLRSTALTRETIDAVEQQQERRVQDTLARFDQYRRHIDDLVELLRRQCDQTQAGITTLVDSCSRMRVELTDRMDGKLAELQRELQQQLQAASPSGQIDSLRESQARTRSELASQFETRLVELQERIQHQIGMATSQEAQAILARQTREQEQQNRQIEQKLGEVHARLQEQLNAAAKAADVEQIRQTAAKIGDLESLRQAMVKPADLESLRQAMVKPGDLESLRQTVVKPAELEAVREASTRAVGMVKVDLENQLQQNTRNLRGRVRQAVRGLGALRDSQERKQASLQQELQEHLTVTREKLQDQIAGASQELHTLKASAEQAHAGLTQRLEQSEARQQGLLAEHKSVIDDLARGVVRCNGQIKTITQDAAAQFAAVVSNLAELKDGKAGVDDVNALREEHLAAVTDIRNKLSAKSTELADMKTSLNGLLARASQAQAAGLQALSARLEDESRQIQQLRQRLNEMHVIVQERLSVLQQECASRTEVEELRQAHAAQAAQVADDILSTRQTVQERMAALRQECASRTEVEELRQAHAAQAAQVADDILSTRQTVQERMDSLQQECASRTEVEELRQAHTARVAQVADEIQTTRQTVQERMAALRQECASRTEVEELRQAHAAQAAQVADEIQTGSQTMQGLIDGLTERFVAAQQKLEVLAKFASNDSQQLGELRQTHAQDVANILQQLEQQRELTQNRFDRAVADWTQTQHSLDTLRATAADAKALEELRHIQDCRAEEMRQVMAQQRQGLESLVQVVDQRCDALLSRLDALPSEIATADDVRAVHEENASNKAAIEAAIHSVAEQCDRTAVALQGLEGRAATQDQVEDLRQTQTRDIETIMARLEGSDSEYQQEFEALEHRWAGLRDELHALARSSTSVEKFEAAERMITEDLTVLKQRLDDVTQRRGKDVRVLVDVAQRLTDRIKTLEEMERPEPVTIELKPQVAEELGKLEKAAEQRASELRNLLGGAGAVGDQLRVSSSQIEQVMHDWLANADLVQQQTSQLRESAQSSAGILQALRKCNESIDSKLKSKRWHSSLIAGEQIAERLEQATGNATKAVNQLQQDLAATVEKTAQSARKAVAQIQAALNNYEQVRDDCESWAEHRDEVRQISTNLAQLVSEAKNSEGRLQNMTTRVGSLATGIAQKTAGLAELLGAARDFDEQQRPTGSPSNGDGNGHGNGIKPAANVTPVNWPKYRTHPAVRAS